MTDELTPKQEADISRLLAEARHDEPIPTDVGARLDAALDELTHDDLIADQRPTTVGDLEAARRRRRNAGRLLLAAAAVVVGGVAVGQTLDGAGLDDSGSADSAAEAEAADAPRDTLSSDTDAGGDDGAGPAEYGQDTGGVVSPEAPADVAPAASDLMTLSDSARNLVALLGTPIEFTADNFDAQVRSTLLPESTARTKAADTSLDAVAAYRIESLYTCADADYGEGAKLPAYYEGQEAVLVLRRPSAGAQRVELLECGTAATLAATDLPAP